MEEEHVETAKQNLVEQHFCGDKFSLWISSIHELTPSDTQTDGTEHLASACRHETEEMIG